MDDKKMTGSGFFVAEDGTQWLSDPEERFSIALFGTNLTDDRYLITGQAQIAGGQIYGTYNRPREWYLMLQVRQ